MRNQSFDITSGGELFLRVIFADNITFALTPGARALPPEGQKIMNQALTELRPAVDDQLAAEAIAKLNSQWTGYEITGPLDG